MNEPSGMDDPGAGRSDQPPSGFAPPTPGSIHAAPLREPARPIAWWRRRGAIVGVALLAVLAVVAAGTIAARGDDSADDSGDDSPGLATVVPTVTTATGGRPGPALPIAVQPLPDGTGTTQPLPAPPSSQPPLRPAPQTTVAPSPGSVAPLAAYRMVEVRDPMIENFVAATFLMPTGWQASGGVQWEPNLHPLAAATLAISDPTGAYTLETFFPLRFSWINDPLYQHPGANWLGSIMAAPRGAAQAVQDFVVPNYRQGARVIGVLPVTTAGLGGDTQLDGARVRVRYATSAGEVDEEFLAITSYAQAVNAGTTIHQWGFEILYSVRGPAGRLDAMLPTMGTIAASFEVDPLWLANYLTVMDLFIARGYEAIRLAAELSQYLTKTYAEISRIHQETWENQQRTYDRIFDNFGDYIRDTQKVQNPNGTQTRTPAGVACRMPDGTILVLPHGATCPASTTHLPVVT